MQKIFILCLLFAVTLGIGGIAQAQQELINTGVGIEIVYPSADICKTCHLDASKSWSGSFHRGSISSNVEGFYSYIVNAIEKNPAKKASVEAKGWKPEMMKCFVCHAPMMEFASESLVKEVVADIRTAAKKEPFVHKAALERLDKLNVSCYTCHNLKAMPVPANQNNMIVYSLGKEGRTPFHETIKGEFLAKPEFCGQCHGAYTAPDGEQIRCSTVWGSYKDEYVAQGGKETCQDCHIKKSNRGHSAPGGSNEEMLREGVGLKVNVVPVKRKGATDITVELVNNAGHRVPGSWMWTSKLVLDLAAKDQSGKVLWSASKEFFRPKGNPSDKKKGVRDSSLLPGKISNEMFRASLGKKSGKVDLEVSLSMVSEAGSKTTFQTYKQTIE
ncbi:MAG: ammonia-forming cytochrome c nitrite reductase subunit c552 [Nitrospirales bacterium]|nr:ammonia-forming cytochrome c nitrite reductase subunit c552 [Nitrospirales bacterium]